MIRTPLPRSMTRIRPRRKPRAGRLKGAALTQLREACFDRDQYRCIVCGVCVSPTLDYRNERSAHMAHIQAKRRGGDTLANVATNCGTCHRSHHAGGKPCKSKHQEAV